MGSGTLARRAAVRVRRDLEKAWFRIAGGATRAEEAALAARPRAGPTRVAVLHFWDTRASMRAAWDHNARVVEHNLRTLEEGLDPSYQVRHYLALHVVDHLPVVETFVDRLRDERAFDVERIHLDLDGIQGGHKLNYVAAEAFRRLGPRLREHDVVLVLCQDLILINHLGRNALEFLAEMALGRPSGDASRLCYGPPRPYVCHTVGVDPLSPEWRAHYGHNGVIGGGVFPVSKLPYVEVCARRSRDWIPAETYLGDVLDERCSYLRPDPSFYFGTYDMHIRTPQAADALLALTRKENVARVVELARATWGGGLNPPYIEPSA